jgi:YfiH family protein
VLAFTTTRLHPTKSVSQSDSRCTYDYFNLGNHVGDCSDNVQKNRKLLGEMLPKECAVQWLEQVHGNRVVVIDEHVNSLIQADAMITRSSKIALAIMTADCLPILLSNHEGTEIAAIHGGWRSLAGNIVSNTLTKMNSDRDEIHAWLGPCIGPEKFEVGQEVKTSFTEQNKLFSQAFAEQNIEVTLHNALSKKKYFANLQLIAQLQLQQLGIKNITSLPECTYIQKDKYYSFRREQVTGRMATIISRN